jgi:hypothetical protein
MTNLYALNRFRNFIPQELKSTLVQSLLFPHFLYFDSVFLDLSQNLNSKLQKLQNACVRYACNLRKYDHVSLCYKKLKWQKIDVLRRFRMMCLLFKVLHSPAFPGYMKKSFVSLSESHGQATGY